MASNLALALLIHPAALLKETMLPQLTAGASAQARGGRQAQQAA